MPKIRKPEELPRDYLHVYWANRWANLVHKKAPFPDARMDCIGCGKEGLIGFQLKHRGWSRRTNLMCDACWGADRAGEEARPRTRGVGKKGGVQRDGSRNVGVPRRRFGSRP